MNNKSRFISLPTMTITAMLTAALSPFAVADGPTAKKFPTPTGPSADVRVALAAALDESSGSGKLDATHRVRKFTSAIDLALDKLEPQSVAAEQLSAAVQAIGDVDSDREAAEALEQAVAEAHRMFSFEPLLEARLPEGVPTYTPVGAIEVKQYPAYRMAKAGAFFTLFRHIQRNDIAMTAPVQMEFGQGDSGRLTQQSMAFLYGSMDLGKLGEQGSVTVVDAEPVTVVSAGVNGLRRQEVLSDIVGRLERWINDHPEYQAAGPVRVMGYNSPFVPATKQYFEVQIPLRKAANAAQAVGQPN